MLMNQSGAPSRGRSNRSAFNQINTAPMNDVLLVLLVVFIVVAAISIKGIHRMTEIKSPAPASGKPAQAERVIAVLIDPQGGIRMASDGNPEHATPADLAGMGQAVAQAVSQAAGKVRVELHPAKGVTYEHIGPVMQTVGTTHASVSFAN